MYDDDLRLIGKRVWDFLLMLIELFSLGCITAEALPAIIGSQSAISLQRFLVDCASACGRVVRRL